MTATEILTLSKVEGDIRYTIKHNYSPLSEKDLMLLKEIYTNCIVREYEALTPLLDTLEEQIREDYDYDTEWLEQEG